ncbi:MAG: hypothetical protein JWN80_295 [Microbacteriaceae bacterium]|jgi:hypothetical protein|nr:hypothetical protein [Microbacteriaceae bacterium]
MSHEPATEPDEKPAGPPAATDADGTPVENPSG